MNWGVKKLKLWNKKRQILASIYLNELKDLSIILPPASDNDYISTWHLFVIRSSERDELKNYLKVRGIETAIHYPKPIFEQSAYKYLGYYGKDLPVTKDIMSEILSLPLYPELSEKEALKVCSAIKLFYAKN